MVLMVAGGGGVETSQGSSEEMTSEFKPGKASRC